jgi:hypothetical protein
MIVMIVRLSEPLWPQQRVREIDQQAEAHHRGKRVVKGHRQFSSEPIAGVAIANRQGDKTESDDQHDRVHHFEYSRRCTHLSVSNGTVLFGTAFDTVKDENFLGCRRFDTQGI